MERIGFIFGGFVLVVLGVLFIRRYFQRRWLRQCLEIKKDVDETFERIINKIEKEELRRLGENEE